MANSLMDAAGAQWVLGVAGADRYPLDGIGGADVDPEDSLLETAKVVEIYGINISVVGDTVELILHDGSSATVLVGMTFDSTAIGFVDFPAPLRVQSLASDSTGNCNIGIRCNTTTVATMFYRKLA